MRIGLAEISQLITAVAAVGAVVMSARNHQKLQEVRVFINGRMDELLAAAAAVARAAGVEEQKVRELKNHPDRHDE